MAGEHVSIQELEEVARKAADQAVAQILVSLGIDATHPFELQRDFAILRGLRAERDGGEYAADMRYIRMARIRFESDDEYRLNMLFLDKLRKGSEFARTKFWGAVITALGTGAAGAAFAYWAARGK
jgi:hypothetical protein